MLIRLVTNNFTFHCFKNASILRNPSAIRQNFRNFVSKNSFRKSENLFINKPLTLAFAVGTSFLLKNPFASVRCEVNRTNDFVIAKNPELKFDWKRLWKYLRGHIWKLLGAIAAALAVAYLNINIPSLLGQLVNALSKYSGSEHGTAKDFLQVSSKSKFEFFLFLKTSF